MSERFRRSIAVAAVLLLGACSSVSEIRQVGADVYTVVGDGGTLPDADAARANAVAAAEEKCNSQGQHYLFVREITNRSALGTTIIVTLTFRCVSDFSR